MVNDLPYPSRLCWITCTWYLHFTDNGKLFINICCIWWCRDTRWRWLWRPMKRGQSWWRGLSPPANSHLSKTMQKLDVTQSNTSELGGEQLSANHEFYRRSFSFARVYLVLTVTKVSFLFIFLCFSKIAPVVWTPLFLLHMHHGFATWGEVYTSFLGKKRKNRLLTCKIAVVSSPLFHCVMLVCRWIWNGIASVTGSEWENFKTLSRMWFGHNKFPNSVWEETWMLSRSCLNITPCGGQFVGHKLFEMRNIYNFEEFEYICSKQTENYQSLQCCKLWKL